MTYNPSRPKVVQSHTKKIAEDTYRLTNYNSGQVEDLTLEQVLERYREFGYSESNIQESANRLPQAKIANT